MVRRYRLKNKRIYIVAMGALLLLFVLLGIVIFGVLAKIPEEYTMTELSEEIGIPVYEVLLPEDCLARPGIERQVKYIVVHETANFSATADAKAHSDYLLSICDEQELSWHYTVDDSCIYHNLPDNEVGWHAADQLTNPGGNLNGIGIEMCVNEGGDYEQTLKNTQKLIAFLLNKYHLNLDDVKQHYDFSGKNCPMVLRDSDRWEEFLGGVEELLLNK